MHEYPCNGQQRSISEFIRDFHVIIVALFVCQRDYEKEIEDLTRELANCKLQLEAKHVAHM